MSADELLSQHLLITGVTGSGKSSTALTIIERLKKGQQNVIVLDPTGEYQSIPEVHRVVLGDDAFFDISNLSDLQIAQFLNITNKYLLDKLPTAIKSLQIQHNIIGQSGVYRKINRQQSEHDRFLSQLKLSDKYFDLNLLANQLQEEFILPYADERADFTLLGQVYDNATIAQVWSNLNDLKQTLQNEQVQSLLTRSNNSKIVHYDIRYLLRLFITRRASKQSLVVDLSLFSHNKQLNKLIIDILTNLMMSIRENYPQEFPVVVLIDEAHRYLTDITNENQGIFSIVREGRKLGLDLILSTQSPMDVPVELIGQFGSLIIHRINTKQEIQRLMINEDIAGLIATLSVGEAYLKTNQKKSLKRIKSVFSEINHDTSNVSFDL
ncbi:hypothetical protein GCM10025879_04470 [Leuconostoc litchii]|uniref:ATP-binding protein n=1 Tax=Leuconostoc litchii TaxID=1981069 RepID=UPI0023E9D083|nr:DUF87 domain-containing protein [Leuconostoc litchii]GMA69201.1 hypothetical protein GCM10025879_04470 [Leuconostoc litchii]